MSVTEKELEAIAVAPRVTKEYIQGQVERVDYFTGADGVRGSTPPGLRTIVPGDSLKLITFCIITTKNGFTAKGFSAVASPENFNKEIGQCLAYEDAFNQLWPLFGFELKTALSKIAKAGPATGAIANFPDVKTYIGTKVVRATPMDRGSYNILRGWTLPENEFGGDEGYLVEYTEGGQANAPGFTGYVSWSPKDVFKGSYSLGSTPKATTFLDRLVTEHQELYIRLTRLGEFLTSINFNGLTKDNQKDLMDQAGTMKAYLEILERRIAKLSK